MTNTSRSKRARLDRFVSQQTGISRREVRLLLALQRIHVDGEPAHAINQVIEQFSRVSLDGRILQSARAVYLMLNKPAGVVSATRDERHRTVIDLLGDRDTSDLHIAGRLDASSTGLLLLTNDGRWSRWLSSPEQRIAKRYRVTLAKPLTPDYVAAFAEGMYFAYEGITTHPAALTILSEFEAEVALTEGRYHQIKRMFGRFRNPVQTLHRVAIGSLELDPDLAPGQSRALSADELARLAAAKAQ
ncbi:pseudouridine synthase [Parahaliea aestuarii]|uniref:Pseudouridine synthase n=1 Tax=Parahaliea aestuarii TaxID=1852021 RepID=A0A5C8ZN32_9GAMM|nr:16S rRNA pseudouridine(516) synthase [Parahaliea aestuarii]TXS89605.1 16S rRNA pseudouridine(516) synthase [Parahaliea aestuarii]